MSPIKGLSEIIRLPRLGKIRLGVRKEGDLGCSYPSPTDYFVCPDEVRRVFGDRPKQLRVMFPTEVKEQWASQYLRCYSATRRLVCRGDGETAMARIDVRTGEIDFPEMADSRLREITCNPERCSYHQCGLCRRVMNLQFLLPDCPGFGVYQLDTSSFHSIRNVNSAIAFVRGVCQRVSMIPLSLELVEQVVEPEGLPKTAHVLRLDSLGSLAEMQRYAQSPPERALLLPAPDSDAPDDLFPELPAREAASGGVTQDPNAKLFELWARAKRKIWHYDVQDSQISAWFEKNCHLTVHLQDFEPPLPPEKFTREVLSLFCRSVDRYAGI